MYCIIEFINLILYSVVCRYRATSDRKKILFPATVPPTLERRQTAASCLLARESTPLPKSNFHCFWPQIHAPFRRSLAATRHTNRRPDRRALATSPPWSPSSRHDHDCAPSTRFKYVFNLIWSKGETVVVVFPIHWYYLRIHCKLFRINICWYRAWSMDIVPIWLCSMAHCTVCLVCQGTSSWGQPTYFFNKNYSNFINLCLFLVH